MDDLMEEAERFIHSYAARFASPAASSSEHVGNLAAEIGHFYRPGMTMFTKGKISRFETQAEAAQLIETEMRNNIASGLGTKLVLDAIEKIQPYSAGSAFCWLRWTFHPQVGSEFEGKTWSFTNVYGYRVASAGCAAGWELVVRDQEVDGVVRVTGKTFE